MELLLALFAFFNLFYLLALFKKDFSIVDIAWGISFLLIYLVGLYKAPMGLSSRSMVLGLLVAFWSLRLSGYIWYRSKKIGKEDYRYTKMRRSWGKKANKTAYFKIFLLQGALSLIIGHPLYLIHILDSKSSFGTLFDYLGLALWVLGFALETIADQQKNAFKSRPQNKGKILKEGLWKYSRHPNYFGEALLWWGLFLIISQQIPFYLCLLGPLLLNFLLLKVSGVALLEKKYSQNLEYEKYKKTTNAFLPWPPKTHKKAV